MIGYAYVLHTHGVADFSLRPFECILSRTKVRYSSAWVSSA